MMVGCEVRCQRRDGATGAWPARTARMPQPATARRYPRNAEGKGFKPRPSTVVPFSPAGTETAARRRVGRDAAIVITRWSETDPTSCRVVETSAHEHRISLCLQTTQMRLGYGSATAFDGVMLAGVVHVTGPGQRVVAEARAPCDILDLQVPNALLRGRQARTAELAKRCDLAGFTLRDALIEQLGRLLTSEEAGRDGVYAGAIVQTLLGRLLHLAHRRPPVGALPKWRLARVQDFIVAKLAEPINLASLARAAGLSRMHFAAQFKAATGCSPHTYLTGQRIEAAKRMMATTQASLAEIALSVGFLAQAHFCTVFKRVTGETPARWRRARVLDAADPR